MTITQLFWLIIATVSSVWANLTIKKYVLTDKSLYLVATMLLYIVILMAYIEIMTHYPMSWLYPITFISLIFVLFSGVLMFDEKIRPINIFGIILGLVAIYLVTLKPKTQSK